MNLLLWNLRYAIQRALGLNCEWRLEPRGRGYIARCRWCGGLRGTLKRSR